MGLKRPPSHFNEHHHTEKYPAYDYSKKHAAWQALVGIKADPDLQRIPVAIWTTSDEVEDRIQCEIAGADVCVTKPVGYAELVHIFRTLVARYFSQRQPRLI